MKTADKFPKAQKGADNFTGKARIEMPAADTADFDMRACNVAFEARSRNYRHSRPGGQLPDCLGDVEYAGTIMGCGA